jgi:energy-converting hydrogenase B subunit D
MTALALVALAGVAVTGTLTVLTRKPPRQLMVAGFFGLNLAILFFVLGAPDVALSQIAVTTVALPLMALLALARFARDEEEDE